MPVTQPDHSVITLQSPPPLPPPSPSLLSSNVLIVYSKGLRTAALNYALRILDSVIFHHVTMRVWAAVFIVCKKKKKMKSMVVDVKVH